MGTGGFVVCLYGMLIVPLFGWRSLFLFEFLALILLPFVIGYLPESIRFLGQKQRYDRGIKELRRMERAAGVAPIDWTAESFELPAEKKVGVRQLFHPKYAAMTILLWATCMCALFVLFGTATWLPALFMREGSSMAKSVSYAIGMQAGTIFGSIMIGRVMDRFGRKEGLISFFLIGGIATYLYSVVHSSAAFYILGAVYGLTGADCISGLMLVSGEMYPTQLRATATGWALTIGRVGAIIGPLLGGALQMAGFTFGQIFIVYALPCFLGAVLVFFFRFNIRAGESVETVTGTLAGTITAGR